MKDEGKERFSPSLTSRSFPISQFRLPRALEILLALAVLLELIAPFTTNTYGVDGHLQVNMIDQFTRLVSDGVLIPRWVPDGFHGFGAATFYFYPPVMLYVASLFRVLFGLTDPFALYRMTGLAATIASFFTARIMLKSIGTGNYQINIGALIFAFAPFRLADLYGRSNLATHVSYLFLPLVWYGLIEIVLQADLRRINRIALLAVSVALLALTNVPAVFATGICVVVAAIVVRKQLTQRAIAEASIALVIAAGLCSYHFLSAISLGPYAHLANLNGGDPQFILLHLFQASSIPALYYIVMLFAAVAMIALGYWKSRKPDERLTSVERNAMYIGAAIVALTVYLETPYLSLPAWKYIPVFQYVQFGWRFYPHFILFVSVMIGVANSQSLRRAARNVTWVWALGAIGPAALIAFSLHIFQHTSRPLEDPLEYRPIYSMPKDDFIERLPGKNADFVPVIDEMTRVYAPHKADPPAIASLQNNERITRTVSKPYFEEYEARLLAPREITFHRFFWPAWHLYINGRSSNGGKEIISFPDTIGRAKAMLPEGEYSFQWKLEKTPLESTGLWISGIAWTLVITAFGIALITGHRKRDELVTSR